MPGTARKYALVTGGSRGLGRAICLRLASMGIPVIINWRSDEGRALEVKNEIEAGGGEAELLHFDVTDKPAVEGAVSKWEQEHPDDYIAYLVNNAGCNDDSLMFMMSDEAWHKVIDVTLDGFFYTTRALLPKMMARKHGGRIVNISSLSGLKGLAGQTNYCAAKSALIGATRALAQETATRNVTVNAVAPGFIDTDMTAGLPKEELVGMIPMRRFGTPDEVAALVGFLCSDDAAYITGEVININGGLF